MCSAAIGRWTANQPPTTHGAPSHPWPLKPPLAPLLAAASPASALHSAGSSPAAPPSWSPPSQPSGPEQRASQPQAPLPSASPQHSPIQQAAYQSLRMQPVSRASRDMPGAAGAGSALAGLGWACWLGQQWQGRLKQWRRVQIAGGPIQAIASALLDCDMRLIARHPCAGCCCCLYLQHTNAGSQKLAHRFQHHQQLPPGHQPCPVMAPAALPSWGRLSAR